MTKKDFDISGIYRYNTPHVTCTARSEGWNTYGLGINDELSAIREAYVLHPYRAAKLAGVTERTWHRWVKAGGVDAPGGMPRERFIAWVRALEADWLARNPGAQTSGSLWRVDEQGRTRRRSKPTYDT